MRHTADFHDLITNVCLPLGSGVVVFLALVFPSHVVGCVADFLIGNSLFSQRKRFHGSDFIMTSYVASQPALAGGSGELYRAPKADSL